MPDIWQQTEADSYPDHFYKKMCDFWEGYSLKNLNLIKFKMAHYHDYCKTNVRVKGRMHPGIFLSHWRGGESGGRLASCYDFTWQAVLIPAI